MTSLFCHIFAKGENFYMPGPQKQVNFQFKFMFLLGEELSNGLDNFQNFLAEIKIQEIKEGK